MTFNHRDALDAAAVVRRAAPRAMVVLGGVHPTLMPEETLASPLVDAVCIGEGEESFTAYLEALASGDGPGEVAGIWYKQDGRVVRNGLRPWPEDLDALEAPDWGQWAIERYLRLPTPLHRTIPVLGSRGCPCNCTFCVNHVLRETIPGRYVRMRSPESLIEEIQRHRRRHAGEGFRILAFIDEIFGQRRDRFLTFCEAYRRENLHREIIWLCNTRANLLDEEWIDCAVRSGCFFIKFGIESGDAEIRNQVYRKNLSLEEIRRSNRILKQHDVMTQYNFILGGPGETRETIGKTLALMAELDPDVPVVTIFQPLPGTRILDRIEALGGKVHTDGWRNTPTQWFRSNVETPLLPARAVEAAKRRQNRYHLGVMLRRGPGMRPVRFWIDLAAFFLLKKWRYHLLAHHVYLYTVFRYQVEAWARRRGIRDRMG